MIANFDRIQSSILEPAPCDTGIAMTLKIHDLRTSYIENRENLVLDIIHDMIEYFLR